VIGYIPTQAPKKHLMCRKMIFAILIFIPLIGFSQIRFVDTVTVSGYFYAYVWEYHKTNNSSTRLSARPFYFVPESTLQSRSLIDHFKNTYLKETATVRFLDWPELTDFGPYEVPGESLTSWIRQVTPVMPFRKKQESYPCGIKGHRVFISFVNIKWLHLRMPGKLACEVFNWPYVFDCGEKAKRSDYDIYLPLQLLAIDQGIELKNGRPFHPERAL